MGSCTMGQAPWSSNLILLFHSLTGLFFLLWKYLFSRIMNLQHWRTCAAWYKVSPNLQERLHWYKHLIRGLFRFKVQGLSRDLCLLNTKECLEQKRYFCGTSWLHRTFLRKLLSASQEYKNRNNNLWLSFSLHFSIYVLSWCSSAWIYSMSQRNSEVE